MEQLLSVSIQLGSSHVSLHAWPKLSVGGLAQRLLSACGLALDPDTVELHLESVVLPSSLSLGSALARWQRSADGSDIVRLKCLTQRHPTNKGKGKINARGGPLHTVRQVADRAVAAMSLHAGRGRQAAVGEAAGELCLLPYTFSSWTDAWETGLMQVAVRLARELLDEKPQAAASVLQACSDLLDLPIDFAPRGRLYASLCVLQLHACLLAVAHPNGLTPPDSCSLGHQAAEKLERFGVARAGCCGHGYADGTAVGKSGKVNGSLPQSPGGSSKNGSSRAKVARQRCMALAAQQALLDKAAGRIGLVLEEMSCYGSDLCALLDGYVPPSSQEREMQMRTGSDAALGATADIGAANGAPGKVLPGRSRDLRVQVAEALEPYAALQLLDAFGRLVGLGPHSSNTPAPALVPVGTLPSGWQSHRSIFHAILELCTQAGVGAVTAAASTDGALDVFDAIGDEDARGPDAARGSTKGSGGGPACGPTLEFPLVARTLDALLQLHAQAHAGCGGGGSGSGADCAGGDRGRSGGTTAARDSDDSSSDDSDDSDSTRTCPRAPAFSQLPPCLDWLQDVTAVLEAACDVYSLAGGSDADTDAEEEARTVGLPLGAGAGTGTGAATGQVPVQAQVHTAPHHHHGAVGLAVAQAAAAAAASAAMQVAALSGAGGAAVSGGTQAGGVSEPALTAAGPAEGASGSTSPVPPSTPQAGAAGSMGAAVGSGVDERDFSGLSAVRSATASASLSSLPPLLAAEVANGVLRLTQPAPIDAPGPRTAPPEAAGIEPAATADAASSPSLVHAAWASPSITTPAALAIGVEDGSGGASDPGPSTSSLTPASPIGPITPQPTLPAVVGATAAAKSSNGSGSTTAAAPPAPAGGPSPVPSSASPAPAPACVSARVVILDSLLRTFQCPCLVDQLLAGGPRSGELCRRSVWRHPRLAGCALAAAYQKQVLENLLKPLSYVYEEDFSAPLLNVCRSDLLGTSVDQLMQYSPSDLAYEGICISFEDEQAFGDGVLREWLTEVASAVFDPNAGLFRLCEGDVRALHISSAGCQQDNHLDLLNFAGRILGLAMRARVPLGFHLSSALVKLLQHPGPAGRARLGWADLSQLDPRVAATCAQIAAAADVEALGLTFVASCGQLGLAREVPLLPGGRGEDVLVTAANRRDYLDRLVRFYCTWGCSSEHGGSGCEDAGGGESGGGWDECDLDAVEALAQGLADSLLCDEDEEDTVGVLAERLRPVSAAALNARLGGETGRMDVTAWRNHTTAPAFKSDKEKAALETFWSVVAELDAEEQRRLLQFWTGISHLPAGGFKNLSQQLQLVPARQEELASGAPAAASGSGSGSGSSGAAASGGQSDPARAGDASAAQSTAGEAPGRSEEAAFGPFGGAPAMSSEAGGRDAETARADAGVSQPRPAGAGGNESASSSGSSNASGSGSGSGSATSSGWVSSEESSSRAASSTGFAEASGEGARASASSSSSSSGSSDTGGTASDGTGSSSAGGSGSSSSSSSSRPSGGGGGSGGGGLFPSGGSLLLAAHTCFFQLRLPLLDDVSDMRAAVAESLANLGAFWNE